MSSPPLVLLNTTVQISLGMKMKGMDVFKILQQSLAICTKNTKFLSLTLLTSLPLFFSCVYCELFFQRTLADHVTLLRARISDYYSYHQTTPFGAVFILNLIDLLILYIAPLHLLELCTAFVTVSLASQIHAEEGRDVTLKGMANNLPIWYERFKHSFFVTSIKVVAVSTCMLHSLLWSATNCCASFFFSFSFAFPSIVFGSLIHYDFFLEKVVEGLFFSVIYGLVYVFVLGKYLESGVWRNMSVVASVVHEKIEGIEPLDLSIYYCTGRKKQGKLLIVVFMVLGLCLRFPCLYYQCYKGGGDGIWVQVGLLCVGNVVKWVAFLVYFYDCKRLKDQERSC